MCSFQQGSEETAKEERERRGEGESQTGHNRTGGRLEAYRTPVQYSAVLARLFGTAHTTMPLPMHI
jgi:hypothetical protein